MDRRVLAPALLVPIILVSFLGGYLAGRPDYYMASNEGQGIRVELYLYRNGELVYYDPDDPATKQFTQLIAELIAGDQVSGILTVDGISTSNIAQSSRPGYVFISYDNVNYTYTMNTLPANIEIGQIGSGAVTFDDNQKSVTLSAVINIQLGGNITAVGLYTKLSMYTGSSAADRNILLFYDPLPTPINVQAGDVVTVVYRIVVP